VKPAVQPDDTPEATPRKREPREEKSPRGGSLEPGGFAELVDETSDESFPASDAPAWTPIASL
jgi:hypothetical protein